jgi:hypothetical protein
MPGRFIQVQHRREAGIRSFPQDTPSRLQDMEFEVIGSTPEQFSAWIRSETNRWGAVVKATGPRVE